MKRLIFIWVFVIGTVFNSIAQDSLFVGLWKGTFVPDNSRNVRYVFEVAIEKLGDKLIGYTFSKTPNFSGVARLNVIEEGNNILLNEEELVSAKNENNELVQRACLMDCTLKIYIKKRNYFLKGNYTAKDNITGSFCDEGYVTLQKQKTTKENVE